MPSESCHGARVGFVPPVRWICWRPFGGIGLKVGAGFQRSRDRVVGYGAWIFANAAPWGMRWCDEGAVFKKPPDIASEQIE
jgi:hypothetical protein